MYKNILGVVLAACAMGSALGQRTGFYSDGRPERLFHPVSGVDSTDVKFLKMAQVGNNFEIESSQIALTNGSGDFVKEFAKEMISDHGAAKNEIGQVASNKSLTVSGTLPREMETKLNQLRMLHGDGFDHAFRAAQRDAHEQAIALFKKEIENGRDQDVKGAAVLLLPTIELHYKMLLSGKTEMGSTATAHGM